MYSYEIEGDPYARNPLEDWDLFGKIKVFNGNGDYGYIGDANDETIQKDAIFLPVYIYSHSGVTISTEPFSCPWDSWHLGWIFVDRTYALSEFGTEEKVRTALRNTVKTVNTWLRGDVWIYSITNDETGDTVDSLCGIYGYDYAVQCAKEAVSMLEKNLRKLAHENAKMRYRKATISRRKK